MQLNVVHPLNGGVLTYLTRGEALSQARLQHPGEVVDPYTKLGSHPEIVERLWDEVGSQLATDCRAVVCGTPALVAPRSGIVFAVALGTEYALRLPAEFLTEAREAGAEVIHHYQTTGNTLNLSREFGADWVLGRWDRREPQWCSATLANAEMPPNKRNSLGGSVGGLEAND